MEEQRKNLASKMLAIMERVGHIEKKGRNDFHKYDYVREADVVQKIREVLIEFKVFLFSTISERQCVEYVGSRGDKQFLITVKIQFTFVDCESGEQFAAEFYGDGLDKGDKGIYKAMTGAQKYALLKTFLIPTGDDPEDDSRGGNKSTPAPREQQAPSPQIDERSLVDYLKHEAAKGRAHFNELVKNKLKPAEKGIMNKYREDIKIIIEKAEYEKKQAQIPDDDVPY